MADVIQVKPQARVRLQKNTGVVLYDQQFAPQAAEYTSHVTQSIVVGTNTSVVLGLGNIAAVRNAMLQMDNACLLKFNGASTSTPMVGTASVWAAYSTSITAIKVKNTSTQNEVTVLYIVTN